MKIRIRSGRRSLALLLTLSCLLPAAAGRAAGGALNPELGSGDAAVQGTSEQRNGILEESVMEDPLEEGDPEEDISWEDDPFWAEEDPEEDPLDDEDPEEDFSWEDDPFWAEEDPEEESETDHLPAQDALLPLPTAQRDPLNPQGTVSARKLSSWTWFRPSSVTATSSASASRSPSRLSDGKEDTCWEFSALDTPLGQAYVYFTFPQAVNVREIWIKNGCWQISGGKNQYPRYARAKGIQISYLYPGKKQYDDTMKATIQDDPALTDWTRISLHPPKRPVGIRIRIMSLFQGTDNPFDLCISEILFTGPKSRNSDPSLSTWPTSAARVPTARPTAGPTVRPTAVPYATAVPAYTAPLYAQAISKLATRSGPGTQYSEPGTFNVQGQWIRILSRAFNNGVWWVQCVIPWRNQEIIAWTGWKRFDPNSLDLESIPLYTEDSAVDELVPVG